MYDDFVEDLAKRGVGHPHRPPERPATEVGALVSTEHYERVLSYVESGRGRRRPAGGRWGPPDHLPTGNYLAPTVFADVTPQMRIFREEIFGPVVCVTPFDDEDDAVRLANDTRYGLAAYVWTNDLRARPPRRRSAVDAGMVWLNSHNVRDLRTPFGGVKESGLGREGGQHSLDFYTETSIVHVALEDAHVPRLAGARAVTEALPNIVRAAYVELIVTDLAEARSGSGSTCSASSSRAEEPDALYLRGYEEATTTAWCSARAPSPPPRGIAFRVWTRPISTWPRRFYGERGSRSSAARPGPCRGIGEAVRVEDPLGFTRRVLPRHRAHRAAAAALRPASRGRHRPHRPLQHLRRRSRRGLRLLHVARLPLSETIEGDETHVRRRGCTASRACTTSPSPAGPARACTTSASSPPSRTTSPGSATSFGRHRRAGPHRARARASRRVQRLLRVPARPRRPPPRGVHQRLLHR